MSTCKWCADGKPEWSHDAKVWIHRRNTLDRECANPPRCACGAIGGPGHDCPGGVREYRSSGDPQRGYGEMNSGVDPANAPASSPNTPVEAKAGNQGGGRGNKMSDTDKLQIALETEIADAIKQFESESGDMVIDVRIDRYDDSICIETVLLGLK